MVLLVVLGLGAAGWLLGSNWGQRRVARFVRHALTHNSELVLAPFAVDLSPWHDFPHLTASIRHLSLTDTSYQQHVPVLRVGRADLRLELLSLLHGQVHVRRVVVTDVDFRERTDSLGRSWGLRGKRRKGTGTAPTFGLALDELLVNNFRMSSHNAYAHSAFGAQARHARLQARLRGGVLRVAGTLDGQLSYLRTKAGTLFEREPVHAWVHYRYMFRERQGLLWDTRATLNGDTIRVSGTHTVDPQHPVGTMLNLQFVGNQPLTEVLRAALPPRLDPYLAGATSPSKAHIHYTISGLSGPTVSPRNILTFSLRDARLQWPDSARRINRWDLQGTFDNGPAHTTKSTVLTLQRCRIYSSAGQLDVALTLHDFTRPFVAGRFLGRTELPELAAVVSPGRWRARAGFVDLDVRVRGLLPPLDGYADSRGRKNVSLRGTVTLRDASFVLPVRGADISGLNVRVGLRDSLWQLSNASGVLNGMRFQASATTTYLLDYLTELHATASINGNFAVDELRVASLRSLLRPVPRTIGPDFSPTSLPKPGKVLHNKAQLAATLGSELIPPGLLLNVGLRCQRLLLATDTLSNLAVEVHHDGQRVRLLNLAGRVWGGNVRGNVQWPTDPNNRVAPVRYELGVRFARINYRQFMDRLSKPLVSPKQRAARATKKKGAASPALRDLLLAANGQLNIDIDHVDLPENESLNQVSLRLEKTGSLMQMPFLRFRTPEGGNGEAMAIAKVENLRLVAAHADATLRYATLDVQRLLAMIASLTTPTDSVPTAQAQARATRRAQRQESTTSASMLVTGVLSAVLRVEADEVSYAAIRGTRFRLASHLLDGEARIDNCSLDALLGHISFSGSMLSTADRRHHPVQAQLRLEDIELPALFATATAMGLNVLGGDNIRGTLRGVADVRTDLGTTFLPSLHETTGYLTTDFEGLELLNVEALMEALKFMKVQRTNHLYFEPFASTFVLTQGQLLIPNLRLNSNLSNLEVSGRYGLDGRTNLFIGAKPLQALFGNNNKRVERVQNGEPASHTSGQLTYVNLRRTVPGEKYKVRFFQKAEQRQAQIALRQECRDLLLTQRLDTTARLGR